LVAAALAQMEAQVVAEPVSMVEVGAAVAKFKQG
jgi:hypothetical protein